MKHEWDSKETFIGALRKCKRCGKEQERVGEQEWGRVVRYVWWPPVFRKCEGKKHG